MAKQAQTAMDAEALDAIVDRGYYTGAEILDCERASITPYVPKPLTSGAKAAGRFGKQDFIYIAEDNAYRCPAGERLPWRFTSAENGKTLHTYFTSACLTCSLKSQCTIGKERRNIASLRRGYPAQEGWREWIDFLVVPVLCRVEVSRARRSWAGAVRTCGGSCRSTHRPPFRARRGPSP
jgi:hypothetical protein